MLETVVFPLVPVMPMIYLGRGILPKKSGHKMMAQLPGIEVPLRPMSFITLAVALANSSAK